LIPKWRWRKVFQWKLTYDDIQIPGKLKKTSKKLNKLPLLKNLKNNFSIKMSEADLSSYHKTLIESFNFNIKSIRANKRVLCKNISM